MVTREELYDLVWSMPMTKVAERFSVSGSYMARVCSSLGVPRPERGYWAKLEFGKHPTRSSLPAALPGNPLFWSQADDPPAMQQIHIPVPPSPATKPIRRRVTGVHPLVQGAKQHYARGYKVEPGQLLRPYKHMLVDVVASATGLDKALRFAGNLFNALESVGHHVCLDASNGAQYRPQVDAREALLKKQQNDYSNRYMHAWVPARCTVAYVDGIPYGLTVMEMTESVLMRYVDGKYIREVAYKAPKLSRYSSGTTWTTTREIASGRLRLAIYAPAHDVNWRLCFEETKTRTLTVDIGKIVKSIEGSLGNMRSEIAAAAKRDEIRANEWQEQKAKWEREEYAKRIAQSVRESRDQLDDAIRSWATVTSIEQFFRGVEERAALLPVEQRVEILARLELAKESIGTLDPLDFFRAWKSPKEHYKSLLDQEVHRDVGVTRT